MPLARTTRIHCRRSLLSPPCAHGLQRWSGWPCHGGGAAPEALSRRLGRGQPAAHSAADAKRGGFAGAAEDPSRLWLRSLLGAADVAAVRLDPVTLEGRRAASEVGVRLHTGLALDLAQPDSLHSSWYFTSLVFGRKPY